MIANQKYKKYWLLPFLAVTFFTVGLFIEHGWLNNSDEVINQEDGEEIREFLEEKVVFIQSVLKSQSLNDSLIPSSKLKGDLKSNNVLFSLLKEGKETLWQENSFNFDKNLNDSNVSLKLVENGWYIMGVKTKGDEKLVLYYQFFFKNYRENESIRYEFNEDVPVKREIEFQPNQESDGSFYLSKIDDKEVRGRFLYPPERTNALWYYLVACILIFVYLIVVNFKDGKFNNWNFVKSYFLLMFGLRLLYYFSFAFFELRNLAMFSPEVYASNFLSSSIGDLTLDVLIWLPIIFYLNHEHNPMISIFRKWFTNHLVLSEIILNISIISLCYLLTSFVKQLILDSVISFSLFQAGSINFYTYVGIFLLFIFIVGVCFLTFALSRMLGRVENRRDKLLMLLVFVSILTVLTVWQYSLTLWAAMMSYAFLYVFTRIVDIRKRTFAPFVFILFFNLLITVLISFYIDYKEKELRKTFAIKALFGYDLEAEDLLYNSDEKIPNDSNVQQYFKNYRQDNEKLTNTIKHNYFTGYLNKYELIVQDYPLVKGKPPRRKLKEFESYNKQFESAKRVIGENYKALPSEDKEGDYLGRFYIASDSLINGVVFVTFKAKAKLRETNFYSSINSSLWVADEIRGYSYALYEDSVLVKSFGDYNYPVRSGNRRVFGFDFESKDGYSHLNYSEDGTTQLVVSNPLMSFTEWVSIFLVLVLDVVIIAIILITLLSLILAFCRKLSKYTICRNIERGMLKVIPYLETRNIFLSTKLHLSMFAIIILTFAVTLLITMSYVRDNYYNRQEVLLKDKMYRLVKSLETSGSGGALFQNEKLIYALSYERGLDINIYNGDGSLLIASNNTIFNEGLIGPKLKRSAFEYFQNTLTQEFQHKESLGELNYLSAYYASYDENYKVKYFVNIPYFTQKSELDREISSYVVNLINFYGLVLIVSFLVAYFLSRKLAEPLEVIRQYMGEIKFGEANKQIIWKNNDEIGQLVQRYNEMLKEIESNAKKLASSEREGAWQEMAKQVAHEIKNPLTPMKLQVQMLQKSWRDKDPNLNEKFERVSALLLERMDAMAEMAIQFSTFSKMPKTIIEKVSLHGVIQDMVDLQSGADQFKIDLKMQEDYIVEVDKEQLSRVFTNLIQNARQAIPEGRDGRLMIAIYKENDHVVCSFMDNGAGISKANVEKIFVPNFSTKNSGMGMGLAICKKIIESFGGKITFTTMKNKGTTFYVMIPFQES